MAESKKLLAALSELESVVLAARSTEIEECLTKLVDVCKSSSRFGWAYDAGQPAIEVFTKFFETAKCIYKRCSEHTSTELSEKDIWTDRLSSLTYEVQSFFIELVPHCEGLRNALLRPHHAKYFCLLLFQLANLSDKLDARISLPLWKLVSNLLQQYKLEVNKAEYLTTDNLKKDVCNASSLDEMLNYLLDSTQHYMKKCMEDEKKWSDTRGMTNINLKMLNLLGRVAAFCVREFSTTALSKKSTTTNGLKQWLFWMTKMRHCGGLCASGTGKNQTLAKSLESSAFLAIDVVLNHLLSHPVLNGKECSVAADLIRYQNHDPEIYCRIYGTVMSSLSRQPQYFDRWFNDEFNLFQEFFSACAQVHFPPETCSDLDCENERLNAMAGEFYTTLLSQVCACICALPANCFNYLESSLLSGLLSEHLWTSLLATDMWCFLARYGTGNLCWQYATTLAEALHRSALELIQSWKPSRSGSVCSSLLSLDRLGRLLARLIVFLTPKHQTEFLCNFRLSCVDPKANGSTRCLLWWFVPLQVGRLQKSAQTMVRDQLSDRLCHLSGRMARSSPESESQSDLFAVIDTAVTLHLVDSMPSCWRESNVAAISQLAIQLVTKPRVHSQSDGELPCASWLSRTILRPKSALIGRLCIWNPHLTVSGLHCSPENPSAHLLQWIMKVSSLDNGSVEPHPSFGSFYILRAWYLWVVCSLSAYLSNRKPDSFDHQWLRDLCSLLRGIPIESVDIQVRPLLTTLIEKLQPVQSHIPNTDPSNGTLNNHIEKLTSTFDSVEQHWRETRSFSAEDMKALRKLSTQLTSLLTVIECADSVLPDPNSGMTLV